jgi:hypothetical protein
MFAVPMQPPARYGKRSMRTPTAVDAKRHASKPN